MLRNNVSSRPQPWFLLEGGGRTHKQGSRKKMKGVCKNVGHHHPYLHKLRDISNILLCTKAVSVIHVLQAQIWTLESDSCHNETLSLKMVWSFLTHLAWLACLFIKLQMFQLSISVYVIFMYCIVYKPKFTGKEQHATDFPLYSTTVALVKL